MTTGRTSTWECGLPHHRGGHRSAEARGAWGWIGRRSGCPATRLGRGRPLGLSQAVDEKEKKRPNQGRRKGQGQKEHFTVLLSPHKLEINILLGGVSTSKFVKNQSPPANRFILHIQQQNVVTFCVHAPIFPTTPSIPKRMQFCNSVTL